MTTSQTMSGDFVQPFQVEGTNVRGQIVRLSESITTILTRHAYPDRVSILLAETVGLSALFGSRLKFDGKITVQAQGDGAVKLLVADCEHTGAVRGFAQFDEHGNPSSDIKTGAAPLLGRGHLAITIDPGAEKDRYQGIVDLSPDGLVASTRGYFSRSEQTLTDLQLCAAAPNGASQGWRLGGLMIQKLPPPADRLYETTHKDLDDWEAASALMKTVQVDELLDQHLEAERLLFRLFHEMGVRVYDPTPIHFSCSCTQDRIENILRTFGAEDIANIVDENGQVRTNCEFCNQSYEFSLSDLDRLGIRPNTTKN